MSKYDNETFFQRKKRFLSKIVKQDGHWLWIAGKNPEGYGNFSIKHKSMGAHRISYEFFIGKIPKGLQIDHLCHIRNCVNPNHLQIVTCKENLMNGNTIAYKKSQQKYCIRGHILKGKNLFINKKGNRQCEICYQEYHKLYYKHGKLGKNWQIQET